MSKSTPPLWKIPSGSELVWTQCGDEHIAYHRASGETHYLNDLSALILRFLEEGSATTAALDHRITQFLGAENSPNLASQIDSLLSRFDQLGVVERISIKADTQ